MSVRRPQNGLRITQCARTVCAPFSRKRLNSLAETDLSKKRGPDLRVTKLSKEQRHNLRVIVRQLEPGARIRHVFYLNSALPDPSNVKSLCHALFDGVASGHLPPSRQIAAQAMAYEAAKNGARS